LIDSGVKHEQHPSTIERAALLSRRLATLNALTQPADYLLRNNLHEDDSFSTFASRFAIAGNDPCDSTPSPCGKTRFKEVYNMNNAAATKLLKKLGVLGAVNGEKWWTTVFGPLFYNEDELIEFLNDLSSEAYIGNALQSTTKTDAAFQTEVRLMLLWFWFWFWFWFWIWFMFVLFTPCYNNTHFLIFTPPPPPPPQHPTPSPFHHPFHRFVPTINRHSRL
jgi:hypothetical protein